MENQFTPYRWVILVVGCVGVTAAFINMTALSPMLEVIAKDLNVAIGTATNLMTIFLFAQGIFLILGGIVADKYGITVSMALGMLCAGTASVLMPLIGSSYWVVFFLRIVQGAAIGLVFGVIGPIVAMWFPVKEQGIAGALLIGSLNIGTALGVWVAPVFLEIFGTWQTAVAILSAVAWIDLVLVLLFTRKQAPVVIAEGHDGAAEGDDNGLFKKAIARPVTWVGCFIIFFNAWAIFGLYNMAPSYLAAAKPMGLGLGSLMAGKLSVALTLFGICGTICGGVLLDYVFKGQYRMPVVIGFLITGIFGYCLLAPVINGNIKLLAICLLLAGFGIPMMDPAVNAFIANSYDPRVVGRMVGLWFGFGSFGSPVILWLSGIAVDRTGYLGWAVAMSSMATIAGAVLGFFLTIRHEKSMEVNEGKEVEDAVEA